MSWPAEEVDRKLHDIMIRIHETCVEACEEYGLKDDYVAGANIAGFLKIADSMLDQGI